VSLQLWLVAHMRIAVLVIDLLVGWSGRGPPNQVVESSVSRKVRLASDTVYISGAPVKDKGKGPPDEPAPTPVESDARAVGNLEVRDDQPRDAVLDLSLADACEIRGA
jgi:hypothetical protein